MSLTSYRAAPPRVKRGAMANDVFETPFVSAFRE
jgi:hypothetical protein